MKLSARKLAMVDPASLWDRLDGASLTVVFDDGELKMITQDVILSAYSWLFVREYGNKVPLTTDMTVTSELKNGGTYNSEMSRALFNRAMKSALEALGLHTDSNSVYAFVMKCAKENDHLYNGAADNLDSYAVSLGILDYIEATVHPSIKSLRDKATTDMSVAELADIQKEAEEALLKGLKREDGTVLKISMAVRAGMIKMSQLLQSILFRGFVQDIDRVLIEYPILSNLVIGMNHVEDFALLGRDSSFSIAAAQRDLGNITHQSVRQGYITTAIRSIEMGKDCGSKHTSPFHIEEELDLFNINGRYIIEDGKLVRVTTEDKERIGTTVNIRNAYNCTLRNKQHVCGICYGDTGANIAPEDGVGKALNREKSRGWAQQPLSMKHVVAGLKSGIIESTPALRKYFKMLSKDSQELGFRAVPKSVKSIKIKVLLSEALGISSLPSVPDVEKIALKRTSKIKFLYVVLEKRAGIEEDQVILSTKKYGVMFTYDFLRFVKDNYRDVVFPENEFVTIDVTEFVKRGEPFLKYPNLVTTALEATNSIISYYEASEKKVSNQYAINDVCLEIYDLMKKDTNLNVVETLLAAYLVRDVNQDGKQISWKVTRAWERGAMIPKFRSLINHRSYAPSALYAKQHSRIFDISTYTEKGPTPISALDVTLQPDEVVSDKRYAKPKS